MSEVDFQPFMSFWCHFLMPSVRLLSLPARVWGIFTASDGMWLLLVSSLWLLVLAMVSISLIQGCKNQYLCQCRLSFWWILLALKPWNADSWDTYRQKGYRCYSSDINRYLVSTDVTFSVIILFSVMNGWCIESELHQLNNINLYQNHPFFINIPGEKSLPMYHMYQLCYSHSTVSAPSQSNQFLDVSEDNLFIALCKGTRKCTLPKSASHCQLYLL